jgi:meiotic recombination protein SPO11
MSTTRKRRAIPEATAANEAPLQRSTAPAPDADRVLTACRRLRQEMATLRTTNHDVTTPTAHDDDCDDDLATTPPPDTSTTVVQFLQVSELNESQVLEGLESIAMTVAHQVLRKQGVVLQVPSRAATNQHYVASDDRLVLGNRICTRSLLNVKEARKTAITLRVMQLLHAVLHKRIHITKRDLFYTDVKLFVDQQESDGVLDDVATMIGCTRSNLHVVASDKGLVVGRVQFVEDGDPIDCTRMGVGGKAIPPYIDKIQNITSDAEFVLLVEKEAAYMRMAEDRFYHRYPCIIITAKGQPDVATRMFLSRLKAELKIPILGLVDSDPYGLKVFVCLFVLCSVESFAHYQYQLR